MDQELICEKILYHMIDGSYRKLYEENSDKIWDQIFEKIYEDLGR